MVKLTKPHMDRPLHWRAAVIIAIVGLHALVLVELQRTSPRRPGAARKVASQLVLLLTLRPGEQAQGQPPAHSEAVRRRAQQRHAPAATAPRALPITLPQPDPSGDKPGPAAPTPDLPPKASAFTAPQPTAPPRTPLNLSLPNARAPFLPHAASEVSTPPWRQQRAAPGLFDQAIGRPGFTEERLDDERSRMTRDGGCIELHKQRNEALDPFNASTQLRPKQARPC